MPLSTQERKGKGKGLELALPRTVGRNDERGWSLVESREQVCLLHSRPEQSRFVGSGHDIISEAPGGDSVRVDDNTTVSGGWNLQ